MPAHRARCFLPLVSMSAMALAAGCSTSESESGVDVASTAVTSTVSDEHADTTAGAVEPDSTIERSEPTLPLLESASLEDVLPVVCDFERYNGLRILHDATAENPAGYEQSLETFVRLILGDRSLPTDESSVAQIEAELARCDALPSLTFANGSHPVGIQIEATVFRTLVPVQQACSWERRDADGDIVDDVSVEAGSTIEIVIEPTDRSVRIDGCGIFVAGTPPTEA